MQVCLYIMPGPWTRGHKVFMVYFVSFNFFGFVYFEACGKPFQRQIGKFDSFTNAVMFIFSPEVSIIYSEALANNSYLWENLQGFCMYTCTLYILYPWITNTCFKLWNLTTEMNITLGNNLTLVKSSCKCRK